MCKEFLCHSYWAFYITHWNILQKIVKNGIQGKYALVYLWIKHHHVGCKQGYITQVVWVRIFRYSIAFFVVFVFSLVCFKIY